MIPRLTKKKKKLIKLSQLSELISLSQKKDMKKNYKKKMK